MARGRVREARGGVGRAFRRDSPLFGRYVEGRPFAAAGIAGLRDFALGTGLSAVAKPLAGMLFTLALGWNGGPKQIALEISSDVMILALFSGVVAALAWAMERAAVLAEENSQFV